MPDREEHEPGEVAPVSPTGQGDRSATNELFLLVYEELRGIAEKFLGRERSGQTLQPTALVHEAYLRLVGPSNRRVGEPGSLFSAQQRRRSAGF